MGDKVDLILEKMTDELQYYLQQELFSKKEVKKIVKERRNQEYKMQRKDATLLFFLDSLQFEKKLDKLRHKRKRGKVGPEGKGNMKIVLMDHSIKKRIMYLYDRAVRKFKENIALQKEYMQYLVESRSFQKLNRVLARSVQIHPHNLDFWLIGVYTELDMRGNLFSSRKLMLQAIRNNPNSAQFYVEYFKYELKFYEKIQQRIQILNGGDEEKQKLEDEKKIDFIMDEEDEEVKSELSINQGNDIEKDLDAEKAREDGKHSGSSRLVEIVFDNINEQFGEQIHILKQCKDTAMSSDFLDQQLKDKIKAIYLEKKNSPSGSESYILMKMKIIGDDLIKLQVFIEKNSQRFTTKETIEIVKQRLETLITKETDNNNKKILIHLVIESIGLSADEKASELFKYKKYLNLKDKKLESMIKKYLESSRNLLNLYLFALTQDQCPKDLLTELEQKSWDHKTQDFLLIGNVKSYIMKEMIKMGRQNLSEEYLKKCLLQFSGLAQLKSLLIKKYSNLIKKQYGQQTTEGVKYLLDQIKKASCLIEDKVYDNLIQSLQLNSQIQVKKSSSQNDNQFEIYEMIYESKLHNGNNKDSQDVYLEYINFLVNVEKNEQKALSLYNKAVKTIKSNQRDQFLQNYNAILSRR
eukprot:403370024